MSSRADRPYGAFPRGHHDVAPDAAAQLAPPRTRIRTALRRALPWSAALAGPALLIAISLAPVPRPEDVRPSATPTPLISEVYAKVSPSVVQVKAQRADGTLAGSGSGVVIDDAGNILTALHVVRDARSVTVVFADGTESSAMIIAQVPESDIAALRPANLPGELVPATLASSASLRIGDDAIVVGNPFALTRSLSTGVISGLDRSVQVPNQGRSLTGLIQFDAAVNPGSSGGPLVNRDGEVIGIVTGLVNPTGQPAFSGVGFAVTIETAGGALGVPPD
ncbi:MAG: S1C family serine protease [Candidatus Limnocylindria bacterium]